MTALSETGALPETTATQLLINGTWRAASDGGTFTDLNPATSRPLTDIASATAADVDAAVTAARGQLSGEWAAMPGVERGKILNRVADLIERDADILARLEALDVGKPIGQPGMLDVPNAAGTFRHFAGWADKITGQTIPTAGYFGQPTHSYTVREPVGVIGAIVPWNTPLMICAWKLGPALAAGNAVVVKPPEDAPLSILHLGKLLTEAGLPDGVVSIVPGLGHITGQAIVDHPGVDKISFTGSPRVGRLIAKSAAETFKRVTLELGGKSPQIILDDADVAAAINGTALGLFFNQGEVCAAGTRVLVHRSLYDQVVDGLSAAADAQVLGDPLDPATTMGALVNAKQRDTVREYIESGKAEGARLTAGAGAAPEEGFFVRPTIFADATNDMTIAREEIFGPVGTVIGFTDWKLEDLELDAPQYGEVKVELAASGMCHSDEHVRDGSVPVGMYPYIGGHEGAGVVTEIGPGVTSVEVGDHVALGFVPACGKCPSCAKGMSSICDLGAHVLAGVQISDGTSRHHVNGQDAGLMCLLGTFAPVTVVNEASCVKLTKDIPLDKAALVGCGVTTGWGSSVYAAGVSAGETVVVLGMGGVGCGAVQGAALAGARHVVLVDPSPFKREQAKIFGATHAVATIDEALTLLQDITWGHLADKVLITVDVADGALVAPAMSLVAKGGVCVQVSVGDLAATDVTMSLFDLTAMRKTFKGAWFGNANIRFDIPHLLRLYMEGRLKLDEMITRTYSLDQVNEGYEAMRKAENVKGVIMF